LQIWSETGTATIFEASPLKIRVFISQRETAVSRRIVMKNESSQMSVAAVPSSLGYTFTIINIEEGL